MDDPLSDKGPHIVNRKVLWMGRRVPAGIYDTEGAPVREILPGKEYLARMNHELVPVKLGSDGLMHPYGVSQLPGIYKL
mgnify:CR=1 FL=1